SLFDFFQYLGKWYELYKLPNLFENKQECVTANYSIKADALKININVCVRRINMAFLRFLLFFSRDGKTVFAVGDAYRKDDSKEAQLSVKFTGAAPYAPYWVLDTDYTSYSLVFSCEQLGKLAHAKFVWILSRTPTIDPAVKDKLFKRLEKDGIGSSGLKTTGRSGCK
ncbi:hypothetical protein LOTGIDRAFT_147309, partial [Lottia gigantea]